MRSTPPRVAVVCDYALDYVGGAQTALVEQVAALRSAGCAVVVLSPSSARHTDPGVRPSGPAGEVAGTGAPTGGRRAADTETCAAPDHPDAEADHPASAGRRPGVTPFGDDVTHVRVPARWVLPGVDLPVLRNSERLRRLMDRVFTEHRVEVVQLHSEFGMAAAAIDSARGRGIPVAHTVHTFFWQTTARPQAPIAAAVRRFHQAITGITPTRAVLADRPADSALRNMTLAVARRADVVVSPSAHQAERLRLAGLGDVVVVPNTVTTTGAAGPTLDRAGEPLRIVWIGRCEPEKRILPFVRAALAARHEVGAGRRRVVVVGDGSQLAAARRIAGEAAADGPGGTGADGGVEFLGRQDHGRIPAILADADLVALTSYGFDNQPMTIVEAVTAGRGVLYCDPALSEGLDGPGIRVPADEPGMAAALAGLVRDPERVVAASHATRRAREEFAPATHARRMLACYERAATVMRSDPPRTG